MVKLCYLSCLVVSGIFKSTMRVLQIFIQSNLIYLDSANVE